MSSIYINSNPESVIAEENNGGEATVTATSETNNTIVEPVLSTIVDDVTHNKPQNHTGNHHQFDMLSDGLW